MKTRFDFCSGVIVLLLILETSDSNDVNVIKDLTHLHYKPINFSIRLWKLDPKFGIRASSLESQVMRTSVGRKIIVVQ